MARGLFTIISVVPLGGIPSRYRLTISSTAGIAVGDHIGARLSGGTSVIYLIDNLLGGTVIEVIDSLTEAEPGEFGLPAPGQAGFSTPEPSKDLTQLPFNSPGWDSATRRNNKIMDGFVGGGGGGGATGPTGPPGPAGPAGADGINGVDGNDGAAGMDGVNGIDGNDGMDGAAGAPGMDGADGADGIDGAVGPQGPQGPQGDASDVTLSEVLTNGNTTSSGTFDNGGIIVSMGDEISGELDLLLRASQDLFLVSDAGDIIFTARGASTPFNEVGQESLSTTAFGSMSIIGALNELVGIASAGVGSLSQTLNVGNTTGMSDIIFSDGGFNLLWGTDGSGDIGSGPTSLDNRPANVWIRDSLQVGDSTVTISSDGSVVAGDDLIFGANGGSIPLNEIGQESLSTTDFGAVSIIGALNELAGIMASSTLAETLALGNVTGGSDVLFSDNDNLLWATDGGGDIGSGPTSLDNRPGSVWVKDLLQVGDSTVTLASNGDINATGTLTINDIVGVSGVNMNIFSADAVTTSPAGWLWLKGGNGHADGGDPGILFLYGGDAGVGSGDDGALVSTRGGAGDGAGAGGSLNFISGPAGVMGDSGDVDFWSASGGTISGNSGDINLRVGAVTSGTTGSINIGTLNASAVTIGRVGLGDLTLVAGSSGDLVLNARNGSITLNEAGQESLQTTAFAATSIIGALNELVGLVEASGTLAETLILGNTTGGNHILFSDDDDLLWATDGGGNIGSGPTSLDNRPSNVWVKDQLQVGDSTVVLTSGGDVTASGTGYFGTALNVGNGITPSTDNGDIVVGDGTASLIMDASAHSVEFVTSTTGNAKFNITNSNASATSGTYFGVTNDSGADMFMYARSSSFATPNEMLITTNNAPLTVRTGSGGFPLTFGTASTERWQITSVGHFIGVADNTYDIGASGATRPRTAYVGTALNVGATLGVTSGTGSIRAGNGVQDLYWIGANGSLAITTTAVAVGRALHVNQTRPGVDAIVSNINNDTTAGSAASLRAECGTVNLNMTALGNSNYGIIGNAGASALVIRQAVAGQHLYFQTGGTSQTLRRWQIDGTNALLNGTSGHLLAVTDNTYDIGASGATRPRTAYFGTSVIVGATVTISTAAITGSGALTINSTGALNMGTAGTTTTTIGRMGQDVVMPGGLKVGSPTTAPADGDIVAGGSVREFHWDESRQQLFVTEDSTAPIVVTTPGLYIGRNGNAAGVSVKVAGDNAGAQGVFRSFRSRGTIAVPLVCEDGDVLGDWRSFSYTTAGVYSGLTGMVTFAEGNHTTISTPSRLTFATCPVSSITGRTRIQINPSGGVLMGGGALGVTDLTAVAAQGDLVVGDGASEMFYDASASTLTVTRNSNAGLSLISVESDADAATSRSFVQVCVDGDTAPGWGSIAAYSSGYTPTTFEIAASVRLGATVNMVGGMTLDVAAAAPIRFGTSNTLRWSIATTGHFLATTDNSIDIGASGATRPRTVHVGTSVVVGDTITISTDNITGSSGITLTPGGTGTIFVNGDLEVSGSLSVTSISAGLGTLTLGSSGSTTDFPSGSIVDFTGAIVTGLPLGIPRQEELTTENIINTDVVLVDVLSFTPVNENPTDGFYESVVLFLNGVLRRQGIGLDYTVAEGTSGIEITWLANSGTAVDMDTSDVLTVVYSSSD